MKLNIVAQLFFGLTLITCTPFEYKDLKIESPNTKTSINNSSVILLPNLPSSKNKRINETLIVPTYLRIFRTAKGVFPTSEEVGKAGATLIEEFAKHGIEICIVGQQKEYSINPNHTKDILEFIKQNELIGFLNIGLGSKDIKGGGSTYTSEFDSVVDYGSAAALGGSTDGVFRLLDQTILHEVGHCFGLNHKSNTIMLISNTFIEGESFSASQITTMREGIRTSETHNQWHQYLIIPESVTLNQSVNLSFDGNFPSGTDLYDNILVTDWSVSPNLKIQSENGDSASITPTFSCLGKGWVNVNIQVGPCNNVSICKEIEIVSSGLQPYGGYNSFSYSCGNIWPSCVIKNPQQACSSCPTPI